MKNCYFPNVFFTGLFPNDVSDDNTVQTNIDLIFCVFYRI